MELFFRTLGTGRPLIILHGLFGSSDNWMSVARSLEEQYHVFLVDLRNHGQSFHAEEFNYQVMMEDLKNFIHSHHIESPMVLGHSMGAKVAMWLALSHPELLAKLVVVDMAPKSYPVHHARILEGLSSIPLNSIKSRRDADEMLASYVEEIGIRQFLLKNLARNEHGGFLWKINLPVIQRNIEVIGDGLREDQVFEKPALFINGGKSDYVTESDHPTIRSYFPQARISTISNAGHWVHAEQPVQFLQQLQNFLN